MARIGCCEFSCVACAEVDSNNARKHARTLFLIYEFIHHFHVSNLSSCRRYMRAMFSVLRQVKNMAYKPIISHQAGLLGFPGW